MLGSARSRPWTPAAGIRTPRLRRRMTTLIIVLLVLWAIFAVVGFVVEGLLWLAFIGLILLVATVVWGWLKRRTGRD